MDINYTTSDLQTKFFIKSLETGRVFLLLMGEIRCKFKIVVERLWSSFACETFLVTYIGWYGTEISKFKKIKIEN